MPVEVSCPGCGLKLKAPDTMIGKKAKCKKCMTSFLVPGTLPAGESVGESQMLSSMGTAAPPMPDDDDVPMASAVEPEPAPPPPPARPAAPKPAANVSSLPSADAFDFGKPKAPAPTPAAAAPKPAFGAAKAAPAPAPAPAKPAAPAPAPAKPVFGGAKAAPAAPAPTAPVAKAAPAPAAPAPAAKAAPPAAKAAPAPAAPATPDAPAPAAPPAKPTAKSKQKAPPVEPPEEFEAPTEPVAEETTFELGASVANNDPFGFYSEAPKKEKGKRNDDEDEPKARKKQKEGEEGEEEQEGHAYRRPEERKSGKALLLAFVLGLGSLAAMVFAITTYMHNKKEADALRAKLAAEQAAKEKKEEVIEPPDTKGTPGKKDPEKKEPEKKDPPPPPAKMFSLPLTAPSFQVRAVSGSPEPKQAPAGAAIPADVPLEKVKQFFPPIDRKNNDAVVVWESAAGAAPTGKGQRLTVDVYSGSTGARVARFDYEGEGKDAKCDVSPDSKQFAAIGPDGKVTVWNLADQTKALDGFDPYADKDSADHKKAGLAGVFFTNAPGNILTVTTAGAVHMFEITTKKRAASFGPLGLLVPNRVVLGKNLAADEVRASIVLAVGDTIYQLKAATLQTEWKLELGGEVGRPMGIAVTGVPGRITYAFETNAEGRKEKALLCCLPRDKPLVFKWPDGMGDPTGAAWAGPAYGVVATTRGALLIDAETKKFIPVAFAEVPGGKGQATANESGLWYLIPATEPAKSVLLNLSLPPDGADALRAAAEAREALPSFRIDEKGLSK